MKKDYNSIAKKILLDVKNDKGKKSINKRIADEIDKNWTEEQVKRLLEKVNVLAFNVLYAKLNKKTFQMELADLDEIKKILGFELRTPNKRLKEGSGFDYEKHFQTLVDEINFLSNEDFLKVASAAQENFEEGFFQNVTLKKVASDYSLKHKKMASDFEEAYKKTATSKIMEQLNKSAKNIKTLIKENTVSKKNKLSSYGEQIMDPDMANEKLKIANQLAVGVLQKAGPALRLFSEYKQYSAQPKKTQNIIPGLLAEIQKPY